MGSASLLFSKECREVLISIAPIAAILCPPLWHVHFNRRDSFPTVSQRSMNSFFLLRALRFFTLNSTLIRQFFFPSFLWEEGSSLSPNDMACSPPPTSAGLFLPATPTLRNRAAFGWSSRFDIRFRANSRLRSAPSVHPACAALRGKERRARFRAPSGFGVDSASLRPNSQL